MPSDILMFCNSPVRLPRVLDQKNLKQQVQVRPQLISVRIRHLAETQRSQRVSVSEQHKTLRSATEDTDLPEKFTENGGGELRILPAAEAQQFHRLLRITAVLDDLLHVAGAHKQDLGHQLLQRHDGSGEAGVTARVRQGSVTCESENSRAQLKKTALA